MPPTPDIVDVAHKNGVPVMGTIFFPQVEHGGKMEWLDTFLTKDENGSFPVVDKLIQVCETYGFDGWFFNQETQGTEAEPLTQEHTVLAREFIQEFKEKAPELTLINYDAMIKEEEVPMGGTNSTFLNWQGALNDQNSFYMLSDEGTALADSMFLDFRWGYTSRIDMDLLRVSNENAKDLGIDPYSLYAGIDLQANGTGSRFRYGHFESSENSTYTSLGLYCPSWTYFSSNSPQDFYDKENHLWVNEAGDPSVDVVYEDELEFRGMSTYITERSSVDSLPFVTNFNLGNGYDFFKDGVSISNLDWNNRSLGDVMPTYRYIIENQGSNSLAGDIDLTSAYYGGNSLVFQGKMEANQDSDVLLYRCDLAIKEAFDFSVVVKSLGSTAVSAVLGLTDGSQVVLEGDQYAGSNYAKISFDTTSLVGNTIETISLRFTSASNQNSAKINLGNLTMTTEDTSKTSTVSKVAISDQAFDEDLVYAGLHLNWTADTQAEYYEIYLQYPNGEKSLLGVSNKETFYINGLKRSTERETETLLVVPVNAYQESGKSATVQFTWPAHILPRASMKADVTLVAPGESITLTSTSSANATQLDWVLEGASKETATGKTVEISYEKAGVYDIVITATNDTGSTTTTYGKQVVVTEEASQGLSNLSQGKETEASSFVNENEAPQFAVDGDISKKWCAVGSAPHDITIDLGAVETISQVLIYNAEEGGEGKDMNTAAYEIYVSDDNENFVKIAEESNSKVGLISNAFAPTEARYVKISIVKPTQGSDSAARIYEIQVLGLA